MREALRAITLSCLLSAFWGAVSWGEPEAPSDWTVDNFRWTGPLAPASRIEVLNAYGDVRLRAADAGEVEVSAMIQRRASEPAAAEVRIRRRRGRLAIEVVYPSRSRSDLRRVDVAVFVPAGAPLRVRTRDGMIQARGVAGDVDLASRGGNIVLSAAGRKDAGGDRVSRLATRKGDITLRLPAGADARLKIRAAGQIAVPPSVRIERRTARGAVVTYGRGIRRLQLETREGGVTLLAP